MFLFEGGYPVHDYQGIYGENSKLKWTIMNSNKRKEKKEGEMWACMHVNC